MWLRGCPPLRFNRMQPKFKTNRISLENTRNPITSQPISYRCHRTDRRRPIWIKTLSFLWEPFGRHQNGILSYSHHLERLATDPYLITPDSEPCSTAEDPPGSPKWHPRIFKRRHSALNPIKNNFSVFYNHSLVTMQGRAPKKFPFGRNREWWRSTKESKKVQVLVFTIITIRERSIVHFLFCPNWHDCREILSPTELMCSNFQSQERRHKEAKASSDEKITYKRVLVFSLFPPSSFSSNIKSQAYRSKIIK